MQHHRTLAVLPIILVVLGCNAESGHRVKVGDVAFCVPRKNVVDVSWYTGMKPLPTDRGFAFLLEAADLPKSIEYVPSLSVGGDPLPVTGVVGVESSGMIDRPPLDHHWVKYAKAPGAAIEVDTKTHTLAAYEDTRRQFWIVWQVDAREKLDVASLPQAARVLASCRRTVFLSAPGRKVQASASCQRTLAAGGLRIAYSFGESNLSVVPELDAALINQVNAWKCERAGAA
jgi:hypothetical protein